MKPRNVDPSAPFEERVQFLINSITTNPDYQGWDLSVLKAAELTHTSPGRTEFEFTVTKEMCNPLDILHGGCASTILDSLTSTALYTVDGPNGNTLTRTLNTTFLRPIPLGTRVKVVNRIVHAGRSYVNLTGTLETMDGKVCVSCVHDKGVVAGSNL